MSFLLREFLNNRVTLITFDGRHFEGFLKGYDQTTNVILQDCVEYIYTGKDIPVTLVNRQLLVLRGDKVAMIGNAKDDENIDKVRRKGGVPLKPFSHS